MKQNNETVAIETKRQSKKQIKIDQNEERNNKANQKQLKENRVNKFKQFKQNEDETIVM